MVAKDSALVRKFDVVIVGAGMVGAAFATRLASLPYSDNLNIAIIEVRPFSAPALASGSETSGSDEAFDPRVVALTEASRALLDDIGVWQQIAADRVCPYRKMQVWDADGTGEISFDCAEIRQASLGHIVENSLILSALLQKIGENRNIELLCPASVAGVEMLPDSKVQVSLEAGECLETTLLVAADGAQSRVREMCGLKLREWAYGHHAIVTTITTEKPHGFTARQRFMSTGPLALLPLQTRDGDCHHCSIVWSQQPDVAEQLMALDDQAFCRALGQASEYCLGEIISVDKRFSFPLRQRHAIDYIKPGVALVGDAAHTIHPLAGQGVNLGFQDVVVLAEEVGRAVERGLSPGDTLVLGRYQRRRKPRNLAMMATMEGFKRLFEEEALPVRLLRNFGLSEVDRIGPLKNQIVRQAMDL